MSNKNRTPYQDAALSIIKGAVCLVTGLQTGRSTKSVKFQKNNCGVLVVGSFESALSESEAEEIRNAVNGKVLENASFHCISIERKLAEDTYGQSIYDDFGVPSHITRLRLVYLDEWNINCNSRKTRVYTRPLPLILVVSSVFPCCERTGQLGRIDILNFKFNEQKSAVEIAFQVTPPRDAIPRLVETVDLSEAEGDLPSLAEVLPAVSEGGGAGSTGDVSVVTPWEVSASSESGIDYDKLIRQFGCSGIKASLISRVEQITKKKAHYLLRRGLFFSHRDLDKLLDAIERGQSFYLYTGRGPSSEALHIGHLVPFMMTQYLQEAFGAPLVVQMTDDEKFLFKENLSVEETRRLAIENARDIIACGFDLSRTFIFRNTDYIKQLYPTVLKIQKKIPFNQVRGIFGFQESDNIGKIMFPAVQAAPAFCACFPTLFGEGRTDMWCLIPQAIDQDPYFRMTRDVAPRLGFLKPAAIHSQFIPALQGLTTKMSGSVQNTTIYCDDSPEAIKEKINKYAFSGGRDTVAEHRELGAWLEVDVPYQYLRYFMEDDGRLEDIRRRYKAGELLTGEVKTILIDLLVDITTKHNEKKKAVTLDIVNEYMNPERMLIQQQRT